MLTVAVPAGVITWALMRFGEAMTVRFGWIGLRAAARGEARCCQTGRVTPALPISDARLAELIELATKASRTAFTGDYEPVGADIRAVSDELEPAMRQLLAAGRIGEAMELVSGLRAYWQDSGRARDGQLLAEAALAAANGVDSPIDSALRARTMLTAGEAAFRLGEQAAASAWSVAAVDTAATAGDPVTAALAEVSLARVAFRDGDAPRIESLSRRALDRAGDDLLVQRAAYHMLAWAAYTAGDRQPALEWFERSLEVRRGMRDQFGVAVELANLGEMAIEAGDLPRAAAYLADAIGAGRRLENLYLLTSLIGSAGTLAGAAGDSVEALVLLAACDAAYESISLVPDPSTRAMLDAAATQARAMVTPEKATAAGAQGRTLTFDDAVSRASAFVTHMCQ